MLIAQPTSTAVDVAVVISTATGGVEGLAVTLRVRNGQTTNSYLDFDDGLFKTSGWVQQDLDMTELERGEYYASLDISSMDVSSGDVLVCEMHSGATELADASEVIAILPIRWLAGTLTVMDDGGGIEGLTPVMRVRLGGTDDYLDWSDMTIKSAGWVTQQILMAEVGRGTYTRALDTEAILPALEASDSLVLEYHDDSGVDGAETIEIGASETDIAAPTCTGITPSEGSTLAPTDPVQFDVIDESSLRATLVWVVDVAVGDAEVAHDGDDFTDRYRAGSTRSAISGGWRYVLRRNGGWQGSAGIQIRIAAVDGGGNSL